MANRSQPPERDTRTILGIRSEPMIVRFGRSLQTLGFAPAGVLASLVAAPATLWDVLWADLRDHVERGRAA